MKLHITLELSTSEESAVAAELIRVLHSITSRSNPVTSVSIEDTAIASVKTASKIAGRATSTSPKKKGSSVTSETRTSGRMNVFHPLIAQLETDDAATASRIASEIESLILSGQTIGALKDAFIDVTFSQQEGNKNASVKNYMAVFQYLNERVRAQFREALIPSIFKSLGKHRPLECERESFFCYAEAFALLVSYSAVSKIGAIQTLNALLQKPETRVAAITALGKSVELCGAVLLEGCPDELITRLRSVVLNIGEDPRFVYDVDYISLNLGWSTAATVMENLLCGEFTVKAALIGHRTTAYCLSYDEASGNLTTNSKDGQMIVWGPDGTNLWTYSFPSHYVCSCDISRRGNMYACGLALSTSTRKSPPSLFLMERRGNMWRLQQTEEKPELKILACVKALQGSHFVTGEQFREMRDVVAVYDSLSSLKTPIQSYSEHEGQILCFSDLQGRDNCFISASKDNTIRLWDSRSARSQSMFGTQNAYGKVIAHEKFITCIKGISENSVVSGSFDMRLVLWDIRMLNAIVGPLRVFNFENEAILAVACGPYVNEAPLLAVSVAKRGLYSLQLCDGSISKLPDFDSTRTSVYHNLEFNLMQRELYAGGSDPEVHVYSMK